MSRVTAYIITVIVAYIAVMALLYWLDKKKFIEHNM